MKKIIFILVASFFFFGFDVQTVDDIEVTQIVLEFNNGVLVNCQLHGQMFSMGQVVREGHKDVTSQLPSAHKTQYETYHAIYENAIKTELGL